MKDKQASLVLGYWQYASHEELHRRSNLWLSEIAFWREELYFMQKLINHHFIYFVDSHRVHATIDLTKGIKSIETQLKGLEEQVQAHEKRLKRLLELDSDAREADYRNEHGLLEQEVDTFLKAYRAIKKALFREADEILQEEKMQRIISMSG